MNVVDTTEGQPLEAIEKFLKFDAYVYGRNVRTRFSCSNDAFSHFARGGYRSKAIVREFDESDLRRAVQFDEDDYRTLHPGTARARTTPWRHFCRRGLRKRWRVRSGENQELVRLIWGALGAGSDQASLLTLTEQLRFVGDADPSSLARLVCEVLAAHDHTLYRERGALLLAQASLALRWPLAAACFVSAYWEALPFCIPASMAPPESIRVLSFSDLRKYCEERNVPIVLLREGRPEGGLGAVSLDGERLTTPGISTKDIFFAELPDARIYGYHGDIVTDDDVLITESVRSAWTDDDVSIGRLAGPEHATVVATQAIRRVSGQAISILERRHGNVADAVAEVVPTLLFALEISKPGEISGSVGNRSGGLFRRFMTMIGKSGGLRGQISLLVPSECGKIHRAAIQPISNKGGKVVRVLDIFPREAVTCARLRYVTNPNDALPYPFVSDARRVMSVDVLREARPLLQQHSYSARKDADGLLFLTAADADGFGLMNFRQIAEKLRRYGFEHFHLSGNDRVGECGRLISEAKFAVVDLSAAAGLLCCRVAPQVIVLAPDKPGRYEAVAAIARATDGPVKIYTGLDISHSNSGEGPTRYLIDAVGLSRVLHLAGFVELDRP